MRPTIKLLLQKTQTHEDFCQINYYMQNDDRQKVYYCLQDNGPKYGGVKFLRCSQDYEASHEVTFSNFNVEFEKPQGDTELESNVREFIEIYERQHNEK